jgi:hypothetical protein
MPRHDSQLPPAELDHFVRINGAHAVLTPAAAETDDLIGITLRLNSILCIHGHVGLGKTFAVHTALRRLAPDTTVRLSFDKARSVAPILDGLWRALELPGDQPAEASAKEQIRASLISTPRVLLVDEVQNLGPIPLEYLRTLWDKTQIPLVLVGSGNARQKVLHHPALHSRIPEWQQFSPLKLPDVLNVIPAYHTLWDAVDSDLLVFADDAYAHGIFRNWVKLTLNVQEGLRRDPGRPIDRDLIRWAFSRLDSTNRFPDRPA